MATQTELLVYLIFHLIRFIFNLTIFIGALLFLFGGCCHNNQIRSSKRQWMIFNLCLAMITFAIIDSVFSMLPLAPTYQTILAAQVCTLQNFLEDVIQGQVAYSLLALGIHQIGPQEWKNRSYLWFGICVGIQWLCSYLLPLPQLLMSNVYICFGFIPDQFFSIYSMAFLLAVPVFLHLIIYIISRVFKLGERTNTQVYPAEHTDPTGINHSTLMIYIFIMSLLFNLIGYGPKGILAIVDIRLQQSIALYAALEVFPSLCLLIDIGLLYKMNREVRKKITSICGH